MSPSLPRRPRIVVVGSCNVDHVVEVERAPALGETVPGLRSSTGPGGKGANQAIAAARLGGDVAFVGAVGDDDGGVLLRAALTAAGVDCTLLRRVATVETGVAQIVVDASGANAIIVVPGANGTVTTLDAADRRAIEAADLLLLQLELPAAVVAAAAAVARAAGTTVMLTPAPTRPLAPPLLASVDVLVPNEHEACALSGLDDPIAAGRWLAERVPAVVVTLGVEGALLLTDDTEQRVAARLADVVDTTGAGDTFAGALAVRRGEGFDWPTALAFASAAAAISVGRRGASAAMPTRDEI